MSLPPAPKQPQPQDPAPHISAPAARAFEAIGVRTLADAARYSERELLALHGLGPKGIRILREHLAAAGLRFRE